MRFGRSQYWFTTQLQTQRCLTISAWRTDATSALKGCTKSCRRFVSRGWQHGPFRRAFDFGYRGHTMDDVGAYFLSILNFKKPTPTLVFSLWKWAQTSAFLRLLRKSPAKRESYSSDKGRELLRENCITVCLIASQNNGPLDCMVDWPGWTQPASNFLLILLKKKNITLINVNCSNLNIRYWSC